jgi:hypothetical protein
MSNNAPELLTVYLEARNQRRKVGRLAIKGRQVLFEYDASFIASEIEISPIKLPRRHRRSHCRHHDLRRSVRRIQ